jgi:hypothetical protein
MDRFLCRQCGEAYSRADFPKGQFHCSSCNWKEMLPPIIARPVDKGEPGEATATDNSPPPEGKPEIDFEEQTASVDDGTADIGSEAAPDQSVAEPTVDGEWTLVLQSSPEEFTLWCERFARMFGFSVAEADQSGERDCDLELTRNGETRFVNCHHLPNGESLSRREAQQLAGALIGRRVTRGVLMTSGTFDDGCRSYVAGLSDLSIDLIDGAELQETLHAITSGSLRKWWQ